MRKAIFALILLTSSCNSWASNVIASSHNIELIVFRQTQVEPVYSSRLAPDQLLAGINELAPRQIRNSLLRNVTSKLVPDNGYEILLHRAWQQNNSPRFVSYAMTGGPESFGHFPVEGYFKIRQDRANEVEINFWVNQFHEDGTLERSEHFQQTAVLPYKELNFIDFGSLAALVRIMPLE